MRLRRRMHVHVHDRGLRLMLSFLHLFFFFLFFLLDERLHGQGSGTLRMDARWVLVYVRFCLSGHNGRGDFRCGLSEIGDRLRGVSVCPIACCGEVLERELRKIAMKRRAQRGGSVCVCG